MSKHSVLEVQSLSYGVDNHRILKAISFTLNRGEILGIIGPNGAGKSSLLKCLMGFHEAEGQIQFADQESPAGEESILPEMRKLSGLKGGERARLISYLSQQGPDQLSFSALEVAEMGAYAMNGLLGRSRYDARDQAMKALGYVGLAALAGRSFNSLSGGEQQMVLFARVLLQDTPILFLDEPTSSLDIGHEKTVLEMLEELSAEGKSSLVAIHNLNLASEFCHRLLLLKNGGVLALGRPDEVLTRDNLMQAYGTDVTISRNDSSGSISVLPLREFPRKSGLQVHIIGGAGSAVNITRLLIRGGYRVSGGVAHRLDSDARLWEALRLETVVVEAFSDIDEDSYRRAAELVHLADITVLAAFPVGRGNLRNLELAAQAERLVILDEAGRGFFTGEGRGLFEGLAARAQKVSEEGLLPFLRESTTEDA